MRLLLVFYSKQSTQALIHFEQPNRASAHDTDLVTARIELYPQLESDSFLNGE
jgi:hypothetical protein